METLRIKFDPLIVIHSERPELSVAHIDRLLIAMEHRIMTKISDFAARQAQFNQQLSSAVDASSASVTALAGDIASLNDKITELQNSPGEITPEDQVLLDDLEVAGSEVTAKLTAVADALHALDAMTPPAVTG